MTFEDIIPKLRIRLHDEDKLVYTDDELLGYYNDAQELVASTLSTVGYEGLIYSLTIIKDTKVPSNFIKFCGQYPVYVNNGVFYPEISTITAQYVGYPTPINSKTDKIELLEVWIPILIQATVMYAQNTEEFALKQDMELIKSKLEGLLKTRVVV